jgi:hypothetical protein
LGRSAARRLEASACSSARIDRAAAEGRSSCFSHPSGAVAGLRFISPALPSFPTPGLDRIELRGPSASSAGASKGLIRGEFDLHEMSAVFDECPLGS